MNDKKVNEGQEEKKPRVFVLDDHPVVRQGLIQLINQSGLFEVCGEASDAEEAVRAIAAAKPEIVIVDISLQGPSGLEFIKMAKEQFPDLIFLVHSMHDETLYAERALRAGARGYVMKHEPPEKVIDALQKIQQGQIYLSEAMTGRILEKGYHGIPMAASPVEVLSDRELEIFRLIGEGETTAAMAKQFHRSPKTIETYRARIKTKLNLKDNMQLIRYAMQWVEHFQEAPSHP